MKILDCTLRDGGYYTNWDFSHETIDAYIIATNNLPLDIIEIGYRSFQQQEYLGEYYYCPNYVLEHWKKSSNKELAIMLNVKELTGDISGLLNPCKGIVTLIRLAVNPDQLDSAIVVAERIKSLGFKVAFNVMYLSEWLNQPALLTKLASLEGKVDYLYMVDSFGSVYPDELLQIIDKIKSLTNIPLGFHGHNNLELALINTITALKAGVEMIDATITGMGRGAGNLKTELLLTVLNTKKHLEVNFNSLSNVVSCFEELRKTYQWGSILPYMVSGSNSLPQKNVMEWVTKRFYSINSIIRALENTKKGLLDNETFPKFTPVLKFKKAIIIGGGPNGKEHAKAVEAFINNNQDFCIIHASAKNAYLYQNIQVNQFFCLVGNEGHRLESVFETLNQFNADCVLPPYPRQMGTYIPLALKNVCYELPQISFTSAVKDSHTVLALQTAIDLSVNEAFLVGYDGYIEGIETPIERSLAEENERLFLDFQNKTHIRLQSLTNTKYKSLAIKSIFSYL